MLVNTKALLCKDTQFYILIKSILFTHNSFLHLEHIIHCLPFFQWIWTSFGVPHLGHTHVALMLQSILSKFYLTIKAVLTGFGALITYSFGLNMLCGYFGNKFNLGIYYRMFSICAEALVAHLQCA